MTAVTILMTEGCWIAKSAKGCAAGQRSGEDINQKIPSKYRMRNRGMATQLTSRTGTEPVNSLLDAGFGGAMVVS